MKFRKKPVVIEAFQVGSDRFYPDWLHDAVSNSVVVTHAKEGTDGWKQPFDNADIKTLEGVMHASRGDWIIKGVTGELYPCKPDIFAATYEDAARHAPTGADARDAERYRTARLQPYTFGVNNPTPEEFDANVDEFVRLVKRGVA